MYKNREVSLDVYQKEGHIKKKIHLLEFIDMTVEIIPKKFSFYITKSVLAI